MGEWEPFRGSREQDALLKYRGEDKWGPRPPKRKRGDVFVILGAAVGMVVGGILGYLLNFVMALVGIVAGGVLGTLAGSLIKSLVEGRRKARAKDSRSH